MLFYALLLSCLHSATWGSCSFASVATRYSIVSLPRCRDLLFRRTSGGFPVRAVTTHTARNILPDLSPVLFAPLSLSFFSCEMLMIVHAQAWGTGVVFVSGCSLELMTYEL